MRVWRFGRPEGPGFGISKGFYLSVLCSRATLPTPRQLADPKPTQGAIEGYLAPMMPDARKEERDQPLRRGAYVLASKDRKTVLKTLVMAREEAGGFDPNAFVRSAEALSAPRELLDRLRAAWTLTQVSFESFDPAVYPSLDFALSFVARLAALGEGVVADPLAERYLLPEAVLQARLEGVPVNALEHVAFRSRIVGGAYAGFTAGLRKFDLPEFEVTGLQDPDLAPAQRFLLSLAQTVLVAGPMTPGTRFEGFQLAEGGFDRDWWRGAPVLELLPPTGDLPGPVLRAWLSRL